MDDDQNLAMFAYPDGMNRAMFFPFGDDNTWVVLNISEPGRAAQDVWRCRFADEDAMVAFWEFVWERPAQTEFLSRLFERDGRQAFEGALLRMGAPMQLHPNQDGTDDRPAPDLA